MDATQTPAATLLLTDADWGISYDSKGRPLVDGCPMWPQDADADAAEAFARGE